MLSFFSASCATAWKGRPSNQASTRERNIGRLDPLQQTLKRGGHRLAPHAFAAAAEVKCRALRAALRPRPGKAHHSDRFLSRSAAGPGDPGDGERDVRLAALERSRGHLARGL